MLPYTMICVPASVSSSCFFVSPGFKKQKPQSRRFLSSRRFLRRRPPLLCAPCLKSCSAHSSSSAREASSKSRATAPAPSTASQPPPTSPPGEAPRPVLAHPRTAGDSPRRSRSLPPTPSPRGSTTLTLTAAGVLRLRRAGEVGEVAAAENQADAR